MLHKNISSLDHVDILVVGELAEFGGDLLDFGARNVGDERGHVVNVDDFDVIVGCRGVGPATAAPVVVRA